MNDSPDFKDVTKKELVAFLKAAGITHTLGEKTLSKANKRDLFDTMLDMTSQEAQEAQDEAQEAPEEIDAEVITEAFQAEASDEQTDVVLGGGNKAYRRMISEGYRDPNMAAKMAQAVQAAAENPPTKSKSRSNIYGGIWVERIKALLEQTTVVPNEQGVYLISIEEAKSILIPHSQSCKDPLTESSGVWKYSTDWRPGYQTAGKGATINGFDARLSVAKKVIKLTPISQVEIEARIAKAKWGTLNR